MTDEQVIRIALGGAGTVILVTLLSLVKQSITEWCRTGQEEWRSTAECLGYRIGLWRPFRKSRR